jgi:hypothetical protein
MRIQPTSNSPRLPEKTSSKRNIIDTGTGFFVPACHDDTCAQLVFIVVAKGLEDRSSSVYCREFTRCVTVKDQNLFF